MIYLKLAFLLNQVLCDIDTSDPFLECMVPDLNTACTQKCEEISLECIMSCDSNDSNCVSLCLRDITDCQHDCPCEMNCLDGCDDCPNPICECQARESNLQWNSCIDDNSLSLGRCVYDCKDHELCEVGCLEEFKARQTDCPCEENCLAGCPCPGYDCIDTTSAPDVTTAPPTDSPTPTPSPDSNAVLVLGTQYSTNDPFVIDFDGNVNKNSVFEIGKDVAISYGCAATLNGEFWYFGGGSTKNRQISKIDKDRCQMIRQKIDLEFDFHQGSCNTFIDPIPKILLCFDTKHTQACHTFDGESFEIIHLSHFSHQHTHGLAIYKGKALTTGCQEYDNCSVATELLDMHTLQWQNGTDYPFSPSRIYRYSTASTPTAAYIIGGRYTQDIIAEYKDDNWRQVGKLQQGRQQHGSISFGSDTMVVGGSTSDYKDAKTEIWDLEAGTYKQTVGHTVDNGNYVYGIGLYIVHFDFCDSF